MRENERKHDLMKYAVVSRAIATLVLITFLASMGVSRSLECVDVPHQRPAASAERTTPSKLIHVPSQQDLCFEPNQGQTDPGTQFICRGTGYTAFLAAEGITLTSASLASGAVRMQWLSRNFSPTVEVLDELPGRVNYFRGADVGKWITAIPTYARVRYRNLYPGIDAIFSGRQGRLRYDFIVAPRADPESIRLQISGVDRLFVDAAGNLVLQTREDEIIQRRPVIYQEVDGTQTSVAGEYVISGKQEVGFQLNSYDTSRPLIIDPELSLSTRFGGETFDSGEGIALDSQGNVYVTGRTNATNFPTEAALQASIGQPNLPDAFVVKLDPTGTRMIFATYLGGGAAEEAFGIAVDRLGNAYVTGRSASSDFPAVPERPAAPVGDNVFVTKISANGSQLLYSRLFGGSREDHGIGIGVNLEGSAYVVGYTHSSDFPVSRPLRPVLGGPSDGFVARLDAQGSFVFSTYLGGSEDEWATAVAVDPSGSAYVTGHTRSKDFLIVAALQPEHGGGGTDAFLAKLNANGDALLYSTYLGGGGPDSGYGVAVDAFGNAYVTGDTASVNFPLVRPLQGCFKGGVVDAFVLKVDRAGSRLLYSTYLGGGNQDSGRGIAVHASGTAFVTGYTQSSDFPTVRAIKAEHKTTNCGSWRWPYPCADVFVTALDVQGGAVYSTYLGGSGNDLAMAISIDNLGNVYITGNTFSADFPISAVVKGTGGATDALLAKLDLRGSSPEDQKMYFAHFGDGEGISSTLLLVNPSPLQTATGVIHVFDGEGKPLAADFNGRTEQGGVRFTIPPQGISSFVTGGKGPLVVGSVEIASDRPIGGVILFSGKFGLAGVGATRPSSRFYVPIESNRLSGVESGVAISNPNETVNEVTAELLGGSNSQPVRAATKILLPPKGHLARFTGELFGDFNLDFTKFEGTLHILAASPVNVMGMRVSPGEFATLPAATAIERPLLAISTFVGQPGNWGVIDGLSNEARLAGPRGMAIDSLGNLYVADAGVRRITPAGLVTTLRPSLEAGDNPLPIGDFGDLDLDAEGNIYFADTLHQTIRKIRPQGSLKTIAGQPLTRGSANGKGSEAQFNYPRGVAVDSRGNIYVADTENRTIQKITPQGEVSTFAGAAGEAGSVDGTGGNARFYVPLAIAADASDNLYITESNHTIRKVSSAGVVTTLVGRAGERGNADGIGSSARFDTPIDVAVDSSGNVYVADTGNQLVRQITPDGQVTTVAGRSGCRGALDGLSNEALFSAPSGIASDRQGNLYVSDAMSYIIRKINAQISPTQKTYFAHFAAGEGISSTLTLVNSSRFQATSGIVKLFSPSGDPLTVSLNGALHTGSLNFTVPAEGIVKFTTDSSGPLRVGSVEVTSDIPVMGTVLFSGPFGVAGVGVSQPLTEFIFPIEADEVRGVGTGVALSNPNAVTVDLVATLRDRNGRPIADGSVKLSLPRHGQLAKFPNEIFDQRIDFSQFQGTLEIDSALPVNGVAIRTSPAQFSTFPTMEVR